MSTPEGDESWSLVMPLIAVRSNGGEYDDASFVAGSYLASISHALKSLPQFGITTYEYYVGPALVPQLDLLAMHLGYRLETEPWDEHPDEWVLARFTHVPT